MTVANERKDLDEGFLGLLLRLLLRDGMGRMGGGWGGVGLDRVGWDGMGCMDAWRERNR